MTLLKANQIAEISPVSSGIIPSTRSLVGTLPPPRPHTHTYKPNRSSYSPSYLSAKNIYASDYKPARFEIRFFITFKLSLIKSR